MKWITQCGRLAVASIARSAPSRSGSPGRLGRVVLKKLVPSINNTVIVITSGQGESKMNARKSFSMALAVAFASLIASAAQAGTILQPTGATTDMGFFFTFEPGRAIDQSGLATGYVSGVTDFDTYVASTGTANGTGSSFTTWFSGAGNTTGNFDFDLGGLYTIEAFALWADPQTVGQTVNSFNLLADTNASFTSPVLLGSFTAQDGTGFGNNASNFGQIFRFTATTASHVRMQILSNHGSTLTTGFVEGAFEVQSATPAQQITDLSTLVQSVNLKTSTANSLLVKLQDAQSLLSNGNTAAACLKLKDFISVVNAQKGKKQISTEQGNQLIAAATQIRAVLNCP